MHEQYKAEAYACSFWHPQAEWQCIPGINLPAFSSLTVLFCCILDSFNTQLHVAGRYLLYRLQHVGMLPNI
jgi:hypothetical protein